jgi:hypothetical protein
VVRAQGELRRLVRAGVRHGAERAVVEAGERELAPARNPRTVPGGMSSRPQRTWRRSPGSSGYSMGCVENLTRSLMYALGNRFTQGTSRLRER